MIRSALWRWHLDADDLSYQDLRETIVERAGYERVGMAEIIDLVRQDLGRLASPSNKTLEETEMQIRCLDLIKNILDQKQLFAGNVSQDGLKFFYWLGSPNEIVGRIKAEWDMHSQERLERPYDFVSLTASDPHLPQAARR